jgi:K+-sensing histidine kinase KdpD
MSGGIAAGLRAPWWSRSVRAAAVVLPLLACMILSTVRDSVTTATSVLVLVVLVVAAAATGDRAAGLLAALSAGVWFDFFLTAPYLQFTIASADDVEATVLLVVISLVVTEVALWGYRQQRRAARRSGYLEGVLGAARAAAEGTMPASAVIDVVARNITDVLGADECRYVVGPVRDLRVAVLDQDGALSRNGAAVDVDRSGLPTDEYVAVLVRRGPEVVGHFLVTAATSVIYPTREQLRIAVLLADQVGALRDEGRAAS